MFLLAGAIVNVGVAWVVSIGLLKPASPWPRSVVAIQWELLETGGRWRRTDTGQFLCCRNWAIERNKYRGVLYYFSVWDTRSVHGHPKGYDPSTDLRPDELAPSWARLRTPPDTDFEVRYVQAFGWPVVSMWRDYDGSNFRMPRLLHGLPVTFLPPDGAFQQAVPLNAAWPGFTVNTLFYAAVLWLLIPGPFALRRFIRVRRGLCPACAYPMGESGVCTECGKAIPSRKVTAT